MRRSFNSLAVRLGLCLGLGVLSATARPALGAPVPAASISEVSGLHAELRKAEAAVAPLYERRKNLDAEATRLAGQIDVLKQKAPGVRRDLDLQALLSASKTKTDELERVQAELRWREPGLAELRRRLVRAIDKALEGTQPEATRLELERVRTATVAMLVSPALPLQIVRDRNAGLVDPLDGPRELRQKADLLRDSRDKLRREALRIAGRIDSVERRRHLRERAGALDEDMFGELQSNRRVARAQGTAIAAATGTNNKANADATGGRAAPNQAAEQNDANQAPAPPQVGGVAAPGDPGGNFTGGGSTGAGGSASGNSGGSLSNSPNRSTESTVLRNLVDPATLDELRRADAIDDVERQTRALKKAQSELEALAAELDRRARALEGRADEIKRQK